MCLCLLGRCCALEHFFDEVDATPGAIKLIAQELIGWARRSAKPTVNTFSQNGLAQLSLSGVLEVGGELGLHKFGVKRPRPRPSWVSTARVEDPKRIESDLELLLQLQ